MSKSSIIFSYRFITLLFFYYTLYYTLDPVLIEVSITKLQR